MTQPAEHQLLSIESILEILRNQAIAIPNPSTSTRYLRALQSLEACVAMERRRPASADPTDRVVSTVPVRSRASNGNFMSADPNSHASNSAEAAAVGSDRLSPDADDNSSLIIDHLSLSLTDWLVSQWLMNTPFTTASLYLDIISSLYGSAAKANLLPPTKLFSELKASLKALGPEGWRQGIDDEIFARSLRLTKNARHLLADDQTAAQLVLYSLTHNLLPLTEIALLKKDCVAMERGRPASAEPTNRVVSTVPVRSRASNTNSRPRYWLPLKQSQRTPKQLSQHIAQIVNALFKRARLPQATDPYQTVEALWAYAALRAGIPASHLVAHLGHVPLGLPVLKLSAISCQLSDCVAMERRRPASAEPTPRVVSTVPVRLRASESNFMGADRLSPGVTEECAAGLSSGDTRYAAIGQIFLENPPRWYAMQLRPGVRFTDICRRIDQLKNSSLFPLTSSDLELFYPSEEISRLIGKKIVTRQRPFIHSVVFFRAKLTDIGRLFSKIGDLAWCYRQSARPGAPYADISDRQFQLFQQTIAHFTPDYEVAATGELELKEGDRVEILGGLFAGQQAIVESRLPSRPKDSAEAAAVGNCADSLSPGVSERATGLSPGAPSAHTVYRLNIIGDNGIDWRISVDPRLIGAAH